MSNILLTCSCDSLAAKVIEKLGANNPVIIKLGTNDSDVSVAGTICTYFFLIALIGILGFLAWKFIDYVAKGISEYHKRRCIVEDKNLKLKADLIDKYLDFLKENASKDDKWVREYKNSLAGLIEIYKKDENKNLNEKITTILEKQFVFLNDMVKKSNEEAEQKYQQALSYLIVISQKNLMNGITQDGLLHKE